MTKFRKKPIEIEAVEYEGNGNFAGGVPDWIWEALETGSIFNRQGALETGSVFNRQGALIINTLEGEHLASPGDWIIRGIKGELYPCKPDIFHATYDVVCQQEQQAQATALPRAIGVSRDAESPGGKSVLVAFERALTDDELRTLHTTLSRAQAASANGLMVDMVPPATARDRWMYEQGRLAERDPRTHASAQAAQQAQAVSDEQIAAAAHHLQEIIAQNGGSPSECAHDHIRDLCALLSQSAAPVIAYTPGEWFQARTIDEMRAFYMLRLPAIREAAKEHGYAIGLHGSTRRDFDLMAMQWRDNASDKDTLAHAIAAAACGITRDGAYQWEAKPNGRFAVSLPICWTDHANPELKKPSAGHIDLSVIEQSAAPVSEQPTFPERDPSKPAEQQGIFRKFEVHRVDGSDAPGGKHYGCRYFVLDLDHDPAAPAGMRAYAVAVRATHPRLAADIEAEFGAQPAAQVNEFSAVEQLSELLRGLEAGPLCATWPPNVLHGMGKAIAEQAKRAAK